MAATDARTIVPLMAFTTGIALIGHTFEGTSGKGTTAHPQVGDAQILLGGTIATVILTLISTGGDIGGRFAKGLSVLALLAVLGVYGGTVAKGINAVTGQVAPKPATKAAPTKKGTP